MSNKSVDLFPGLPSHGLRAGLKGAVYSHQAFVQIGMASFFGEPSPNGNTLPSRPSSGRVEAQSLASYTLLGLQVLRVCGRR